MQNLVYTVCCICSIYNAYIIYEYLICIFNIRAVELNKNKVLLKVTSLLSYASCYRTINLYRIGLSPRLSFLCHNGSATTFSITTLSILTVSITTLSMKGLFVTLTTNDFQQYGSRYRVLFCRVSLC